VAIIAVFADSGAFLIVLIGGARPSKAGHQGFSRSCSVPHIVNRD
jgi:hypothetical protein